MAVKHLSVLIKPASSLCDLGCRYCFYAEVSDDREIRSFGLMSEETAGKIIRNVFSCTEARDEVIFAFQGGEPTLAGLPFFRAFTEEVERARGKARVSYALQTNGILLDEEWCLFLREHDFLVGLSLDAMKAVHDANRVDGAGKGTYARVMAAKALLEKHKVEYNVLTVLTNELARHPQQVWNFLVKEDIRFVQFIPCLGGMDGGPSPFALTPKRFASFYTELFRYWSEDFERGRYRSVKLFDDLINLLAFGVQGACGLTGQCMPQIVVEADGSVYPCDFYALDEYRTGYLSETPIDEVLSSPAMAEFRERPTERPVLCEICPYDRLCGGGCPRMRQEVCGGPDARDCGYRFFLEKCLGKMQVYALRERRARTGY